MTTNKWLIGVVVLLVVMNISAIVTMLYHKKQEIKAEEVTLQEITAGAGPSIKYSGRWFKDELGLTREQMREFSGFNPSFRQKTGYINRQLTEKRKLMLDEMAAENSDTIKLNILADSIGKLHSELKKATYSYYLEFKRICTPEQHDKLMLIFNEMFGGNVPMGGRGMGMPGGRGRGIRWKNN